MKSAQSDGSGSSCDSGESDPYREICRSLQEGVLLTVNASDPSQAGFGEVEVSHVDTDTGSVTVMDGPETMYEIVFDDSYYGEYDGPVIKERTESEFQKRVEKVTTIEIVGIAG